MAIVKNEGVNVERTFGVEIEMISEVHMREVAEALDEAGIMVQMIGWQAHHNRNYSDNRVWKLTTDGSVHAGARGGYPMELVSPPLSIGTGGLEVLKKVLDVINSDKVKARVNKSCGLHVHHDANDYDVKAMRKLVAMNYRYQDAMDELMAPSRRREGECSNWCRPIEIVACVRTPEEFFENLKKCKTIEELATRFLTTRYCRLNLRSYVCYGTVEFRQHSASTEYEKIVSWIILTQMMVERSLNGSVQLKKGSADDWFNFKKIIRGYAWMGADELQQNAVEYFNKRRQYWMKKVA